MTLSDDCYSVFSFSCDLFYRDDMFFFHFLRSNPDGYGVAPHCLDPGTVENVTEENFDGQNWEQHIQTSDIASRSKE